MGSINREILSLAIPSIITNITTPLLALMDVAIVGHMGAPSYIAAIAVGGTMFNMIYWLFAFLRMGTSGLSAQAHGAADIRGLDLVLARGILVSLIASALIILLSPLILRFALYFMEVKGDIASMVSRYFDILVWGSPAVLATYTFSGWALGRKNPRAPMWVSLIINLSNITVSLVLVLVFHLKITGVACGTLSAQWIGAIVFAAILAVKYRPSIPPLHEILEPDHLKRFFTINRDIFLRTCCLVAVTVWFTRCGASQGTTTLAVNTLLMQFFMFFSYFMDGFAFAGESMCGNYLGAGDKDMLMRSIHAIKIWAGSLALGFAIIYFLLGGWIITLLSDDQSVINASHDFVKWVILIPVAGFLAFTWDGVFIGITHTRQMLQSMATATLVYFIVYLLLFPILGNHGLWIAFLCYLLSRGIVLQVASRKVLRHL